MYPSQQNRTTLAIDPLRLEQAKKLAELWGKGWTARLVVEALIKDAIEAQKWVVKNV